MAESPHTSATTGGVKDGEPENRLFFTTSDLMNRMNKTLSDLESPSDAICPRVELQKRLPDGSTRRADEKDLAAADMQNKITQVRQWVVEFMLIIFLWYPQVDDRFVHSHVSALGGRANISLGDDRRTYHMGRTATL